MNGKYNFILERLETAGYQAYLVGGCVRDFLMNREVHDFDITTDALPDEITETFRELKVIPTGLKHGTVTVLYEGEPFEITTFRIDGSYSDSRRPDSVEFTSNLEDDLSRRDFTMNAIAMDLRGQLCDPFGGAEDIKNKIIRCVGSPEKRFSEDALRILRAVRFASQLDFSIEKETADTVLKLRENLDLVSRERIREELDRLICGQASTRILLEYREIIAQIIPELRESFDFNQHSKYHRYDVYEHTVRAVEGADSLFLKRTMLLHDIAKPAMFRLDENGVGHFRHHAEAGAEMAREIMKNLRYDNKTIDRTYELIYYHSDKIFTETDAKKVISEIGAEQFFELIKLKKADNYAKNEFVLAENEEFDMLAGKMKKLIEQNVCMSLSQLAADGRDISGIGAEGRKTGEILNTLLRLVIEDKLPNSHEILISYAKENLI